MTSGIVFKLVCTVAYGLVVGLCVIWAHSRHLPHTVAAANIGQFQLIRQTDIVPIDQKDIVGHYARRPFAAGDGITPQDVSVSPALPPAGAVGAVVLVPRSGGVTDVAKIKVQVCLDGKPVGNPSIPITSICDDKACVVTVPIDEVKELADPGAAKRLQGFAGVTGCASDRGATISP